jgi:TP901 family phage tail tape measure protein
MPTADEIARLVVEVDSRDARRGADQVTQAFRQINVSVNNTTNVVNNYERTQERATRGSRTFATALIGIATGFGAIQGARGALSVVSGFERTIVSLGGVSQATVGQLEELEGIARDLGSSTEFSAQQAAEGLLFLARAGFTVEQQIAAIPSTLDLASVAQIDLGRASDIASNAISQFRLQAEDTNRVNDALVNTSNRSNTSIVQLAEALNFAGPVAGALGISIEETAAVLGVFGDSGIQASSAGTNLRGILVRLLNPTAQVRDGLASIGVSLEDVNPQTNSLAEIFARLRPLLEDGGAAAEVFGLRNVAAGLAASGAAEKIVELVDAQLLLSGETEKLAELQRNTLTGQLRAVQSAAQEAALAVGEAGLTGAATDASREFAELIRFLAGATDGVEEVGVGTRALADGIVLVTAATTSLGLAVLISQIGSASAAVEFLTFQLFRLRFAVVTNPITALVTVLGTVATAAFIWREELGLTTRELNEQTIATERLGEALKQLEFSTRGQVELALASGDERRIGAAVRALQQQIERQAEAVAASTGPGGLISIDQFLEPLGSNVLENGEVDEFLRPFFEAARERALQRIEDLRRDLDVERRKFSGTVTDPFESAGTSGTNVTSDEFVRITKELAAVEKAADGAGGAIEAFGVLSFREVVQLATGLQDVLPEAFGVAEKAAEDYARSIESKVVPPQQKAIESFADLVRSVQQQQDALSATGEDLETIRLRYDAARLAAEGYGEGTEEARAASERFNEELERLRILQEIRQVSEDAANVLAEGFADATVRGREFGDVVEDVAASLLELAIQQAIVAPIANVLTAGFFSLGESIFAGGGLSNRRVGPPRADGTFANGAAFSAGEVVPFASGGVVTAPTFFPMSGGRRGLMGEDGEEGIFPLGRDSAGRLGVRSVGGGGGTVNNFYIQTPDADSFRRSRRAIQRDFGGVGGVR